MSSERLHAYPGGPRRNRGRGFTLVEMAMTGAVLGLIAAIAVPSYGRVLERQRINQCAMDLRDLSERTHPFRMGAGHTRVR